MSLLSGCGNVGLLNGDEILVIDGQVVADLDITYIESLLHDRSTLRITVRSCLPAKVSHKLQPTAMLQGIADLQTLPSYRAAEISKRVTGRNRIKLST